MPALAAAQTKHLPCSRIRRGGVCAAPYRRAMPANLTWTTTQAPRAVPRRQRALTRLYATSNGPFGRDDDDDAERDHDSKDDHVLDDEDDDVCDVSDYFDGDNSNGDTATSTKQCFSSSKSFDEATMAFNHAVQPLLQERIKQVAHKEKRVRAQVAFMQKKMRMARPDKFPPTPGEVAAEAAMSNNPEDPEFARAYHEAVCAWYDSRWAEFMDERSDQSDI